MPVDLTQLPQIQPPLKKFSWRYWTILLIVFIAIGCLITIVVSFFYPQSNLSLVLYALVLPTTIWLLVFLYGIYYRGYREAYIKGWNLYREKRRQQLIDYARRGLYVLHYSLTTEYGQKRNASSVVSGQNVITAKIPNGESHAIAHTTLPLPDNIKSSFFYERLEIIFKYWRVECKSLFALIPTDLNIHVRLFIDTSTPVDNLEKLWQKTFGKLIFSSSFRVEDNKNSSTFIEKWLDNSEHDDDLLLLINVHLFSSPKQNEAESAVLMLLVGEQAINRLTSLKEQDMLAKIYRSEQTDTLEQTIDNTLLWGQEHNQPYDGVWCSGVTTEQNIEIMNHFNYIEFEHGNIFNIDTSIGNTQNSAYFFATALAIEHALETNNKQLIIIGQPKITASVVTTIARK